MGKQKGYDFEKEVGNALNTQYDWNFKIADTRTLQFKQKAIQESTGIRMKAQVFAQESPYDFQALHNGVSYAFECKCTKFDRFPKNYLKPHQEVALKRHEIAGGKSYLLLNRRDTDLRKKSSVNALFCVSISDWQILCNKQEYKASIPFKTIKKHSTTINKDESNLWQLNTIIQK